MRKANRLVELEDLLSSNFFRDQESLITAVLKGHLTLEAILVELIQIKNPIEKVWKWPFPKKTQFLVDNNLIFEGHKDAYDSFNEFRNDFSHIFDHQVNLRQVLDFAKQLEQFGIAFSDSVGHYSEAEAINNYEGIDGVIAEIIWCLLFEAANSLMEAGGRNIF